MKTALVCIAKWEDRYADEWIRYHTKIGFDKIFMYENDWRYKGQSPILVKIPWDGKFQQRHAYMDFIRNRSQGYDWVAFFDLDEFLVLKQHSDLRTFLASYDNSHGIAVNLITFGANGKKTRGKWEYSLLKQFTRRSAVKSDYVKLIVRLPAKGEMIDPHHWNVEMMGMQRDYFWGSLNTQGTTDVAVINHYAVKSYEDWKLRCDRGYPFSERKISYYEEWEIKKNLDCEVKDLTAKEFLYGQD